MIVRETVRLGEPVMAAGRVLTPVLRVRYTVAGGAGFGAVEPLGIVVEEAGETVFFGFDLLRGWDWIAGRLGA